MRILVVEDEKHVADFIVRGLREEGYSVDAAYDGETGHYQATVNDYDLIILDLMLPKMDGLAVCRDLRCRKLGMPIIMLTAKDAVKDKIRGLDSGANDYLTKPFAFEELLARVRVLLRGSVAGDPNKLVVGDLELNLLSHTVTRAGEEIALTNKEYSLLEYLMRNAGTVVTRTMLSEHVWDMSFDTLTNVIDVYINYLRGKIDQGRKKKMIRTIRGRGYVLKG
jgi:two-component system copper resistance phosphate regulon response regulator CusR